MSSVLRKKIDAASGIPPTLYCNRAFWAGLRESVSRWTVEVFDSETDSILTFRRTIMGKAIPDFCDDGILFKFEPNPETGLRGIIFNKAFALFYVSKRLRVSRAEAAQTSPLFLRLAGEECALALYQHLAASIAEAGKLGDYGGSVIEQAVDPDDRLLAVGVSLLLGEQDDEIVVLLDHEVITSKINGPQSEVDMQALGGGHNVLRESVKLSEIEIDAVIDKISMSVGECSRLEIGQTVPLPTAGIKSIDLMARTITGDCQIAKGELGVWHQNRALKLNAPISASFIRDFTT